MAFPPIPVYPKAIDSDYTLYLVHNTTETRLTADNAPWAQEISILPVSADKADIWADNGFGNLQGELFYYDSVEKNDDERVIKLKGCARQLGGENTRFNARGSWIRSYVVAEHHNQMVDAILKTQDFIGYNFDPRRPTLDWRIRNLQELEVIFDDFSCPDINFTFNIIENSPILGVLSEYLIEITPPGSINTFRLDFGDGDFTTTDLAGQHRYALNARIDPIVRVANDRCQIIQTPIERSNPAEPPPEIVEVFDIPIPEVPTVPDFIFVPCEVPEIDIQTPPLVIPCISLEGQIGPIPSVITGPNINLVSNITVTGLFPLPSIISIVGNVNIPSLVVFDGPNIPPTVVVDSNIPSEIIVVPPDSNITIDLDISQLPMLQVDWGRPPEMEVNMTLARQVKTPERFAVDPELMAEFGTEFADLFEVNNSIKVEYESVGIPSEIRVIMPDDHIRLDTGDLFERKIQINSSGVDLPKSIQIHGPESPIPNSIKFDASELPEQINLVYSGEPIKIDMPTTIQIEMEQKLPEKIMIEMVKPIPEKIVIESSIPDQIELIGPKSIPISIPPGLGIPLLLPAEMPSIELKYSGKPIEVKITLDDILSKEADGRNCVMIVPCPTK